MPVELGYVYWRRERAHDKTGEGIVFVVCTADAFIGWVDNVKTEQVTRGDKMMIKFDKATKIDKETKGVQTKQAWKRSKRLIS